MIWEYGTSVVGATGGQTYWCLRSGDIPHEASGKPKIWWRKCGVDNGDQVYIVAWEGDYSMIGLHDSPTVPATLATVRVFVREYDALFIGLRLPGRRGTMQTSNVIERVMQEYLPAAQAARPVKQWPHDCPKCRRRECALQLFTTWDCKYGCWS